MFSDSYLSRTGQLWKIWTSIAAQFVGLVALFVSIKFAEPLGQPAFSVITFVSVGAPLLAFAWMCYTVRCSECGTAIVWRAMRRETHNLWLMRLLMSRSCPVCEDAATIRG